MIANAAFNAYILCKYPQYEDAQRSDATSEIKDYLASHPAFAQKIYDKSMQAGTDLIKNNPEIARQGAEALLSSAAANSSKRAAEDERGVYAQIEDDDRRGKNNNADDAYSALNPSNSSSSANDNAGFIKNQKLQTREMVDIQDKNLDQLGQAVDRLGEIGRTINTEIKEQDVLLDALGNEIDDASNKMNTVQGALEKLLQTKDGCQIWTIVILAFILILLVALVIWT
eukprot:gene22207-28321_t